MVAESTDNGADLAWIDNIPVELFGGIVFIAILLLPAFATCGAFAVFDQLLGFEFAAIKADFGINQIDFIAYVYAIGNGWGSFRAEWLQNKTFGSAAQAAKPNRINDIPAPMKGGAYLAKDVL